MIVGAVYSLPCADLKRICFYNSMSRLKNNIMACWRPFVRVEQLLSRYRLIFLEIHGIPHYANKHICGIVNLVVMKGKAATGLIR